MMFRVFVVESSYILVFCVKFCSVSSASGFQQISLLIIKKKALQVSFFLFWFDLSNILFLCDYAIYFAS